MLACCTQALRSYQLEGTHIAVIRRFCYVSLASSCAEGQRQLVRYVYLMSTRYPVTLRLRDTV